MTEVRLNVYVEKRDLRNMILEREKKFIKKGYFLLAVIFIVYLPKLLKLNNYILFNKFKIH